MDPVTGIILGIVSLIGTIVGVSTNRRNNEFIEEMNEQNQQFQEETNQLNHQWSLEAAEWEYQHNKPQTQYADLLAAGLTPAAAAQTVSGANVSYSPATASAPQNVPKSTNLLNDSLTQVIEEIGNFSSMSQAQAAAEKTKVETKVITETSIKKANAEIDKILSDTLLSYSQINVADSQSQLNEANTQLANEKVTTEQTARTGIELTNKGIDLSNDEKQIQLDFTRKTLEMSVKKTEAEIKYLAEQTAKLQGEVTSTDFDNKFKEWRNTFIDTFGVAPEQGWQDMLFKAMSDGKGDVLLDSLAKSLRLIFSDDNPYEYENERYLQEQIDNGRTLDVQHYIGPWRLPSLKDLSNRFFSE